MSRYIDADKLQEDFKELHGGKRSLLIDTALTADARKNVRGEWIDCGVHGDWAWEMDGHGNCWHIWKCSKCEYKTEHCSNFCPNCGAQMMRGEA